MSSIETLLSSASLLLTLIVGLYAILWPRMREVLNIEKELHAEDRRGDYDEAKSVLCFRVLPMFIASALFASILTPDAIAIIRTSVETYFGQVHLIPISMYRADWAAYLFVTGASIVMAGFTGYQAWRVWRKMKDLDPEAST